MPNSATLRIGDSVKILHVPEADRLQRATETTSDDAMLPTATVLEKVMAQQPVVIIDQIDDHGQPWFTVRLDVNGNTEIHTLALMDDDSWALVHQKSSEQPPPKAHKIAEIRQAIDHIMDTHEDAYQALAQRSEALYAAQKSLERDYSARDEQTGLSALFEALGALQCQTD